MRKPASSNKQSQILILLIDKQGDIGKGIVLQLQLEKISFSGVIATRNFILTSQQDILFCPFEDSMPLFPDGDYSHIVVVYNGEEDVLQAIPGLAKKAKNAGGVLFIIIPIRFYTKTILEKIQATGQHTIIIGDIFGENILQEGTTIDDFFTHAKKEERIVISGMGLESTYPVYIDDVVVAITRVVFVKKEKKATYLAIPPHPPTKLSLARMFQKIDPILRIDLVGEEEKNSVVLPTDGIYLFDNNYSVEEKIKNIYKLDLQVEDVQEDKKSTYNNKKNHKATRSFIFYFLSFFFLLFLLPITSTIFFMTLGAYDLMQAKNAVLHGDSKKMEAHAKTAEKFLRIADKTRAVFNIIPFPQKDLLLTKIDENLTREKIITTLLLETSAVMDAWTAKNGVATNAYLRNILANLQKMQAPSFSTTSVSSIVDIASDMLGFAKSKTYLILLQNNMELRPGGGFIGSYAIAKINKGEVAFSLHDVYDADGQLKGHIEPPFAIRRHLKSIHWYLRDSNFSPDFQTNASSAAFFLQQETGEVVDGVVAVDVSFVKMLVSAFGKIDVPDYNETITKDNFYTVVENHAEKDFFPGSTQKKDFLQSLFRAMQVRLEQKDIPYQSLYKVLLQGLAQKHVLVASREQPIQNIFTVNGMSSAIIDRRSAKDSILDFVGISEANVGVNKANVGISRRLSYDVEIDKNASASAKLTITYKNEKLSEGKDYKNYLRIIMPYGSMLTSISIDNDEKKLISAVTDPKVYEAKIFLDPKGLEVTKEEEGGKTLFGFLVTVPLGKETVIVAKYQPARYLLALPPTFTYDLLLYKQPGTESYPISFSLSYPDAITPVVLSKDLQKKEEKLLLQKTILGDEVIAVTFGQK